MKILLTGATGYIGKRMLPELVKMGHQIVCCVRDIQRFNPPKDLKDNIEIIEVDFLKTNTIHSKILNSKIVRPIGPRFYQTVVDVKIQKN